MKLLGIGLVVVGIVALLFGEFGFDQQKTVFSMGGVNATVTEHQTLPMARVAGILALVSGVVLVAVARRRVA